MNEYRLLAQANEALAPSAAAAAAAASRAGPKPDRDVLRAAAEARALASTASATATGGGTAEGAANPWRAMGSLGEANGMVEGARGMVKEVTVETSEGMEGGGLDATTEPNPMDTTDAPMPAETAKEVTKVEVVAKNLAADSELVTKA